MNKYINLGEKSPTNQKKQLELIVEIKNKFYAAKASPAANTSEIKAKLLEEYSSQLIELGYSDPKRLIIQLPS